MYGRRLDRARGVQRQRRYRQRAQRTCGKWQRGWRKPSKRKVRKLNVLDAFDVNRTFLGIYDDEAMHSLLSCEAQVVKLLHSKVKQSNTSDFFIKFWFWLSNISVLICPFSRQRNSHENEKISFLGGFIIEGFDCI